MKPRGKVVFHPGLKKIAITWMTKKFSPGAKFDSRLLKSGMKFHRR